ncbi:MAG: exo-alpha-sialidase [Bacteroidota bacterium]
MAQTKKNRVYLLVGTHKGAFVFVSDLDRKNWEMNGPFLKGADVNQVVLDTRNEPTIYACVNSSWWGPNFRTSRDFGQTWVETESGIRFPEGSGNEVKRVWCVTPGLFSEPKALYVGVDPAALFRSEDGGQTWNSVDGLTNHPTRAKWTPGAGGMMVHSICLDPQDPKRLIVGISAAGVFYSEDRGTSWEPRNKGVRADFLPETYPEVGQCVHHLENHPSKPAVLFQQNHCGVYRSDNRGKDWIDISEGLPSRFGFGLQIHPHDPDTIYVCPEEGAEFRCPVNGEFGIYRSRDRGEHWEKLSDGLPEQNVYVHVHRQAMGTDTCDPCGIYVGTSGGQILYSRNEGKKWETLAQWLPPIFSVSCSVV